MTTCNRCGAISHWEADCTQPARSRKKRSSSAKSKGKSRGFRREKSDGKGRGGSSNYPIVEVYNDGSKNQTSHMKVPPGYAALDCGAAKSLCGAKLVALMAQACARESIRLGDERDTEAIDESYQSKLKAKLSQQMMAWKLRTWRTRWQQNVTFVNAAKSDFQDGGRNGNGRKMRIRERKEESRSGMESKKVRRCTPKTKCKNRGKSGCL